MIGLRIRPIIGIGDAVQFSMIPENYFRHFGEKVVDLEHHWIFDHNPYVVRNVDKVDSEYDLWNLHCLKQIKLDPDGRQTFRTLAESHLRHFQFRFPILMNRPRLYRFEDYQYLDRQAILLHVKGKSHGQMPDWIVRHVMKKYGTSVRIVGKKEEWNYRFPSPPHIETPTLWQLAETISKARMFIGVDSGPSWIAQCYPDVVTKKVRLIPADPVHLHKWMPLEWCNLHSHWDDRSAGIYNVTDDDLGFTWSYKRI